MTKKESLDFLNSCIEYIDSLSEKEISDVFMASNKVVDYESDFDIVLPYNTDFETIENNVFLNMCDMISASKLSYKCTCKLADLSKSTYNNAA